MVVVAQLVRALDCGSRGRRFETGLPPHKKRVAYATLFLLLMESFFYKEKPKPMFPMTMPFSETPCKAGISFVLVGVYAGLLLSVALKVTVWGKSPIP